MLLDIFMVEEKDIEAMLLDIEAMLQDIEAMLHDIEADQNCGSSEFLGHFRNLCRKPGVCLEPCIQACVYLNTRDQ